MNVGQYLKRFEWPLVRKALYKCSLFTIHHLNTHRPPVEQSGRAATGAAAGAPWPQAASSLPWSGHWIAHHNHNGPGHLQRPGGSLSPPRGTASRLQTATHRGFSDTSATAFAPDVGFSLNKTKSHGPHFQTHRSPPSPPAGRPLSFHWTVRGLAFGCHRRRHSWTKGCKVEG